MCINNNVNISMNNVNINNNVCVYIYIYGAEAGQVRGAHDGLLRV